MIDLYLQYKYVGMVASSLEGFSKKNDYLWNFRCPYCGDSKKSLSKKRGYIFKQNQDLFFKCHNCHESKGFIKFLKENSPPLFEELRKEMVLDKVKPKKNVFKPKKRVVEKTPKRDISLPSVNQLSGDHIARKYCLGRKIPTEKLSRIYFCEDLSKFAEELQIEKKLPNDQRLIFPFYNKHKTLLGFQARLLTGSGVRYYTIKLNEENAKVFGLDVLKDSEDFYIVEGPIDSLFLENSIAMMGSDLTNNTLPNLFNKGIFVYDNEPRNKQIVTVMSALIEKGHKVCIWPDNIKQKDINDMVIAGVSDIGSVVRSRTFTGLKAKIEFMKWRRV